MKGMFFLIYFLISLFGLGAQQAQELIPGIEIFGNLDAGEEHWFSIQAAETGRVIVYTSGNTDTYLEAYDSDNSLIGSNDDGGAGTNARLRIPVEAGRTYLFKLRGYDEFDSGPYRIIAIDGGQQEERVRQTSNQIPASGDENNIVGTLDISAGLSFTVSPEVTGGHFEFGFYLYRNFIFIQNRFVLRGGGFKDDDGLDNTVLTISEKLVLGRNNFEFFDIYLYIEGGVGFFINTQTGFSENNLAYNFGFGGGLGLGVIDFGGLYVEVGYLGQKMLSKFPISGVIVQTGLRIFL
jgi:hypothetical protein